jgi:hypothetical protein
MWGVGATASRPRRQRVPQKGRLTGTASTVLIQPVASLAEALEGASKVGAVMLTAAMARGAFVYICGQTGLLRSGTWGPCLP